MSGYATQILAILIINVVAAYAAYMPLVCGQLNLGIAGFMAIGAYTSAVLNGYGVPLAVAIPGGALASTIAGLAVSIAVLRGARHLSDDRNAGVFRSRRCDLAQCECAGRS